MLGGCAFYFRNRGAPTFRALASACNYSQLGFRVHPPTLKGGFLAFCFPSQLCRKCAFHSKTELSGCGSSRPVPAANTSPLAPCKGCSKAGQRATWVGQQAGDKGRAGWRGRPLRTRPEGPGPWNLPAWGRRLLRRAPQMRSLESASLGSQTFLGVPKKPKPRQRWGSSLLHHSRSIAWLGQYSPRIPGGFTLPHRSDETLGRGPR